MSDYATSDSPYDENVNLREDYSFTDADEEVNRPKIQSRVRLGFNYGFCCKLQIKSLMIQNLGICESIFVINRNN